MDGTVRSDDETPWGAFWHRKSHRLVNAREKANENMEIVSVINYKGGVGKTTVTANIGADLAARGYRVLLIDLDAQASLTFSFVQPDVWERDLADSRTIKRWYDSFTGDENSDPLSGFAFTPARVGRRLREFSGSEQLSLIASHLGLINVDLELASDLGGATLTKSKLNYLKVHRRLLLELAKPEFSDNYDLVLIDCPPNFNIVTKTAIVASDHILIPARPDYLSTLGIDYLRRSLRELVRDYNEYAELETGGSAATTSINPGILGIVFTMVQVYARGPMQTHAGYMSRARKLGVPVFDKFVRGNQTHFPDASGDGVPLTLKSSSQTKFLVDELEGVATEFISRLGLKKP